MRRLLFSCLTSTSIIASEIPSWADTTISNDVTGNYSTGQSGNISITDDGSISAASGSAIVVNSNNDVSNAGEISIEDADDTAGIVIQPGVTAGINNSGTISLTEDYTASDTDDDGDTDGQFASGYRRFGILSSGSTPITGDITNSGTISIEGNESAGIKLQAPLSGNLDNSGTISVTGDNSFGISIAEVSGNISLTGAVSALGANATAIQLGGDIGGSLKIQNTVTATGYRTTSLSSLSDDAVTKLDADDVLQGGPALSIKGDVAGGILLDASPEDNDDDNDDEDNDGVTDSSEGTAAIYSYGASPAVEIGSATRNVSIGALAGDTRGHGLVVNGSVYASGVYDGIDATALSLGGLGGTVTIIGGITVNGTVSADSRNNTEAVLIGADATVPELVVSGTVGSSAYYTSNAVHVAQGGKLSTIENSGTISATSSNGGIATAILDKAGSITNISNSGIISVSGNTDSRALDLGANQSGVTITQTGSSAAISGAIVTGSGDDLLDIQGGNVTGSVSLNDGSDIVRLSGTAALSGEIDFGAGEGLLYVSDSAIFSGNILGDSSQIDILGTGGTLALSGEGPFSARSLALASGATLALSIDPSVLTSARIDIAGTATIEQGAILSLTLKGLLDEQSDFTLLQAGSLVGGDNFTLNTTTTSYLYKTRLASDTANGTITVNFNRKTASELGLNRSGTAIYEAAYEALKTDSNLSSAFAGITDAEIFNKAFSTLLPDHSGGLFDSLVLGEQAMSRNITDARAPRTEFSENLLFWLEQGTWRSTKPTLDSAGYKVFGWSFGGGVETQMSFGRIGVSLAYLYGESRDRANDNLAYYHQMQLGIYWMAEWKGIQAHARFAGSLLSLGSTRSLEGTYGGTDLSIESSAHWGGSALTGNAGIAYEQDIGIFFLRPDVAIEYFRMNENAHSETGGGTGFDLTVERRHSRELAANYMLTAGLNFGSTLPESMRYRLEIQSGYRSIISGSVGATTARYANGEDFTLFADQRQHGTIGRMRFSGSNGDFSFATEVAAEKRQQSTPLSARVTVGLQL